MNNLAFSPLLVTLITCALCLVIRQRQLQQWLSIAGASIYFCVSCYLLWSPDVGLPLSINIGNWPSPFGISFNYTALSALLICVTGAVYLCVCLYARPGENSENHVLLFPLIHLLIFGISGAFLTNDLFNLYVWFEVILLSSFVLLTLDQDKIRLAGSFKYVILNVFSSLIFLLGAGLVYNSTFTLNLTELSPRLHTLALTDTHYVDALSIVLFIAFAIKSALFPFFFWLPASYHTLSPALSALFAGLLTKVGLYAIYRVNLFTFPASHYIQAVLTLTASLSILIGVGGAIVQSNIRRILGFHIISQVGYIALAGAFAFSENEVLRVFGIASGIFYMVHHILVKANLYLVSGLIRSLTGSENLNAFQGLASRHSLLAFLFAVPALSLAGIPPLSGFWAKLGVFQASLSMGQLFFVVVMILGGFFTVFSMSKIWLKGFWGADSGHSDLAPSLPFLSLLACILLSTLTLTIGLFPDFLFEKAQLASHQLTGVLTLAD